MSWMNKICVYTSITGDYDNLREVTIKDKNVDFICYTNNKNIKSKIWKVIYIENEGLNNHQLSRKIKMLGTDYINNKYQISIWQDASVVWDKEPSLFVKKYLKKAPFASFKHFGRSCIYDEAGEVIRLRKEKKEQVIRTIEFLKKEQFPKQFGLYEMTVFIKKNKDETVKKAMELWYKTYLEYSKRDQLSFMYAVWKNHLKIDSIHLSVWENDWFHCIKHNYKEELTECRVFYGDSSIDEVYNYNLDYVYPYKIKDNIYSFDGKIPEDTSVIEIDITNVPCIEYSNFIFTLPYNQAIFFNTIPYKDSNVFYNDHGIVRIEGNFKKNQKYTLSITLNKLNDLEKYEFINDLSNNLIIESEEKMIKQNKLNEIYSSKLYKIYAFIRKLKR